MSWKTILIFGALFCSLLGAALWMKEEGHEHHHGHHHHHDHEEEEPPEFVTISEEDLRANGIETKKAGPGNLQIFMQAPAKITIHPDRLAHVVPKVSGIAQSAKKNLGEKVAEGELLAILESREMAEAKAAYLAAIRKENLQAKAYQREQNLHEKKISATQDYQNAQSQWEEANIDLELARQKLHALGIANEEIAGMDHSINSQLRFYELRSPIAGTVINRHITPGELLSTDHEVYVIADLSTLLAEINLFPKDLTLAKEGHEVTLISADGVSTKGKILFVNPVINDETRTAKALVEIDNTNGEWYPGNYACAHIGCDTTNVPILVPKDAIQTIEGNAVVFVNTPEGFAPREVTLGRSDNSQVEVLSGLSPNETYACKNTFLLKADLKKHEAEHEHD